MWVLDNNSPSAFLRTITDRRRCRSIPTYSRSTGTFFRRVGVALASSSLAPLETPRREKVLFATVDIIDPPTCAPTNHASGRHVDNASDLIAITYASLT